MTLTDADFEKYMESAAPKISAESKIKIRQALDILMKKMIYIDKTNRLDRIDDNADSFI
jgi:hypothetical protein